MSLFSKAIVSFSGDHAFLSNFYSAPVEYNGCTYKTSEHAYQAAKTVFGYDHDRIAGTRTPGNAKREGRKIQCRMDWEEVKFDIMGEIVYAKFLQNEDLKEKLLATGNAFLVEGNNWGDTFWGVCEGEGLNVLGTILMVCRTELGKDHE